MGRLFRSLVSKGERCESLEVHNFFLIFGVWGTIMEDDVRWYQRGFDRYEQIPMDDFIIAILHIWISSLK